MMLFGPRCFYGAISSGSLAWLWGYLPTGREDSKYRDQFDLLETVGANH